MKKFIRLAPILSLIAAAVGPLALPACGSSDNGAASSASFATGLPPAESLGSISDSDETKLCDALAAWAGSAIPQSTACRASGFSAAVAAHLFGAAMTDADVRKACTDTEAACNKAPAVNSDAGAATTTTQCNKPPTTCTATVGQLESCLNDSKVALDAEFSKVTACSSLTVKDVEPTDGGGLTTKQTVPSCAPFQTTACQGVVSMGADSSTGGP